MVIFASNLTSMLKAFYTSFYPASLVAGIIVAALHFSNDPGSIGRFAAMVAFLTGIVWWVYVFTLRLRNATFAAWLVTVASAMSLLIAIGSHYITGDGSLLSVRMALTALVLWLIYHLISSRMGELSKQLTIGEPFPDAPLYDASGREVQLSQLQGKKMLLFYRGKWCPFCVDQGRDFAEALDAFEQKGVTVAAITTEKASNAPSKVLYHLQDRNGALGKQLGIFNKSGLPIGFSLLGFSTGQNEPLAVLVDEGMRIVAVKKPHDNRKRPSPEWFLRYLR